MTGWMTAAEIVPIFVTLFVIIDPVGLAPLFVALTSGQSTAARRRIAIQSVLIAAAVLTLFGILGEAVLTFVGISMPAFRIAGGILLFLTALEMLFERRARRREDQALPTAEPGNDPSVFPIAVPLIAGPGAITTMILLTGRAGNDWTMVATVHGVAALCLCVVLGFFLLAGAMERLLGPTGINVITRLLGMLLAALSVQFVLDGLKSFGLAPG